MVHLAAATGRVDAVAIVGTDIQKTAIVPVTGRAFTAAHGQMLPLVNHHCSHRRVGLLLSALLYQFTEQSACFLGEQFFVEGTASHKTNQKDGQEGETVNVHLQKEGRLTEGSIEADHGESAENGAHHDQTSREGAHGNAKKGVGRCTSDFARQKKFTCTHENKANGKGEEEKIPHHEDTLGKRSVTGGHCGGKRGGDLCDVAESKYERRESTVLRERTKKSEVIKRKGLIL